MVWRRRRADYRGTSRFRARGRIRGKTRDTSSRNHPLEYRLWRRQARCPDPLAPGFSLAWVIRLRAGACASLLWTEPGARGTEESLGPARRGRPGVHRGYGRERNWKILTG